MLKPYTGAANSVQPKQPEAYFHRLPSKRILTLNMDVPEAWLVEATQVCMCPCARGAPADLCVFSVWITCLELSET